MSIKINSEDLLNIVKNNTYQKVFLLAFIAGLSFFVGRSSAPKCEQSVICADIIRDRDELSSQLSSQYKTCQIEKEKEMKSLTEDLNQLCAERVSDALLDCKFAEDLHCPICIARGICKP